MGAILMSTKTGGIKYQDIPLEIVGSTKFGRFPKMSSEQTFNMIISDDWLVPFGGYQMINKISPQGQGRGILTSTKFNKIYMVIDNDAYSYDSSGSRNIIGTLQTFVGDVYIAENNIDQVIFSDSENLYCYNTITNDFDTITATTLGFTPGYITFQNGRFITGDIKTNAWRLSLDTDGKIWPFDAQHVGAIETKPTLFKGVLRFPGKGNMLLVFGETVSELFQDTGATLFPYQRNQSVNIDYGLINPATLAGIQDFVCWVGINEQAGPAIMFTGGSGVDKISTDGIDYKLAELTEPTNCYAFMVRLSGHLCYIVTWVADNLTYLYDFNTKRFFTLCDENMNAFIVKRVAFFNDQYYFVSLRDGNLYQLKSNYFNYDYGDGDIKEIPMIRILPNIQFPDQSRFVVGYSGFTIQSGSFPYTLPANDNIPRVDLSLSTDGGVNYGSNVAQRMRPQGLRRNRLMWYSLGSMNDLVHQYRFHGLNGPFVCSNGVAGVYQ
jgi:hypothetical protein